MFSNRFGAGRSRGAVASPAASTILLAILGVATLTGLIAAPATAQTEIDPTILEGLEARSIGPAVMSGRISALDAVATDPLTIYVGTASGGLWKSDDGGVTFEPIFDDHIQSIGAVTVDPTNSERIWVGTGETWVRNSVSVGDGLYRSDDGGESWTRVGLEDSERIARIVVDPEEPDNVYVCATGHLWDANEQRGVYETTDGGESWERILYVDADTGCADLDMDPQEPEILYASMWQFRREPDFFTSGGPGSGLYRSTDGGDSWQELTEGLPEGDKGRIGIGVAPSRPSVVYAVVEAEENGLYRSDDLGEHWELVNSSFSVAARPFYFATVTVDPTDHDRVYKPGFSLGISNDGGRSFTSFIGAPGGVHSDVHCVWINPEDPYEVIQGTDGGLYVSRDRANTWLHVRNLPVSQFYEVATDQRIPYNVYGGLQDNGTWTGPSRGVGGIDNGDWENIGSGDGFHAYPDVKDPDIVYVEFQGGNVLRHRVSTGATQEIRPYARQGEEELRFNWNTPIEQSSHRPGILYVGAQYLFRSRDRGDSWERISPDLTTDDPERQRQEESGGLTIDNSTAENNTTIFTIAESPLDEEVIWVGTDDGNVQITRDGGESWANVVENVAGVPPRTWVSHVAASHHDPATAYVTFDGHRTGDMATYLYRTTDYGESWEPLVAPPGPAEGGEEESAEGDDESSPEGWAHVVVEDPVNPNLLFLGTEQGLFVSVDGGTSWARFESGLPPAAVRDLEIHPREQDLVVATHGRGIFIVDDVTPLRHLTKETLEGDVTMLPSRPAVLTIPAWEQDFPGNGEFSGENPPEAARIDYYLRRRHMFGDLMVEIHDADGELVATHPGGKRRGINRVEWPMRKAPPKVPPASSLVPQPFAMVGPLVAEGTYRVVLIKGDDRYESTVELVPDPRSDSTAEDRALQDELVMRLYGMIERLTPVVEGTVALRDRARTRAAATDDRGLAEDLREYADRIEEFRATLVAVGEGGFLSGREELRERLVGLYGGVNSFEGRPTGSQFERADVLESELVDAEARWEELTGEPLRELNERLEDRDLDPLRPGTEG